MSSSAPKLKSEIEGNSIDTLAAVHISLTNLLCCDFLQQTPFRQAVHVPPTWMAARPSLKVESHLSKHELTSIKHSTIFALKWQEGGT